ncbi:protein of unknown function [Vibrio tapetis subsp. tapetis]|uniref:Uncharacterized protein n=1 Tax=Vibrio tapetis subsp. tapetis TaxID=1671868 RepID=A0A2N8ZJ19_9VIBR|nr:protein of unknown function [Vibrio tapetis subsp. tapetis]
MQANCKTLGSLPSIRDISSKSYIIVLCKTISVGYFMCISDDKLTLTGICQLIDT